jgi:hypothetical protein
MHFVLCMLLYTLCFFHLVLCKSLIAFLFTYLLPSTTLRAYQPMHLSLCISYLVTCLMHLNPCILFMASSFQILFNASHYHFTYSIYLIPYTHDMHFSPCKTSNTAFMFEKHTSFFATCHIHLISCNLFCSSENNSSRLRPH